MTKAEIIREAKKVLLANGYETYPIASPYDILAVGSDVRVIKIMDKRPSERMIEKYVSELPSGVRGEIWVYAKDGVFKTYTPTSEGYVIKYNPNSVEV